MRPEQLLPPELAANWPPLYERALSQGPFRCEYSFVNGHILELSLNPIVVDGKTTGISVFGKDITECKRTAEALAESEARFRTFFDENSSVMTQPCRCRLFRLSAGTAGWHELKPDRH
jgi:PAS domain-containing protein